MPVMFRGRKPSDPKKLAVSMHQFRKKVSGWYSLLRLLFFGIALILRNVWVWLHAFIFADKGGEAPVLRLELLRFRRMLNWLATIAINALHDGSPPRSRMGTVALLNAKL